MLSIAVQFMRRQRTRSETTQMSEPFILYIFGLGLYRVDRLGLVGLGIGLGLILVL